ncbi:MAG: hypothetical protein H6581_04945 [Bacteroidia bacterium]|nr:hypothetical protein [Bacteroidia bacterium]
MENSRFMQALAGLSRPRFRRFREMVESPFFNKNKRLIQLIRLTDPVFPRMDHPSLAAEKVYPLIFPGEKMPRHPQKLYDLLTRLNRLLSVFFQLEELDEQPLEGHLLTLAAFGKRGMEDSFEKEFSLTLSALESQPFRDADFYGHAFRVYGQNDLFYSSYLKEFRRTEDKTLQIVTDHLDTWYLAEKFRQACRMVNRQNVFASSYDFGALSAAMDYYDSNPEKFDDIPAVSIYYTILKTLQESEEEGHFTRLMSLLALHAGKFGEEEARSMYNFAENYCIKKINSGRQDFQRKLFELFRELIRSGLILQQGWLSQWDYKNIVSVGLLLEEFAWVRQFLEDFRDKLNDSIRENAYNYNLAHYHYFTGDHGKALRLLQRVEFVDVFYHLGTKTTILKIYYEMNETESLLSHISAFKTFLRRNKLISSYQHSIYNHLLDFCKQAYRLKLKLQEGGSAGELAETRQKLAGLQAEVEGTAMVASKSWLLGQVSNIN